MRYYTNNKNNNCNNSNRQLHNIGMRGMLASKNCNLPHHSQGYAQGNDTPTTQTNKSDTSPEALVVESWLDDHPEFAHDYFVRKANRQLIDDWLSSHARINNSINISPRSDFHSNQLMSRPVSQLSLNTLMLRGSPWRLSATVAYGAPDSMTMDDSQTYESSRIAGLIGAPGLLTGRSTRSNSQSGGCSTTPFGSILSRSGAMTPVRKISATDFESRTGNAFLRPMLSTTPDGRQTFLAQPPAAPPPPPQPPVARPNVEALTSADSKQLQQSHWATSDQHDDQSKRQSSASSLNSNSPRVKRDETNQEEPTVTTKPSDALEMLPTACHDVDLEAELVQLQLGADQVSNEVDSVEHNDEDDGSHSEELSGEVKLIFELVRNICDDLDIRTLLHKILKNIAVLINADRSSLFLVCGDASDPNRHLASQLFNVDQDSAELGEPDDCIIIPWGTGLVGYVAESGESVNIADCYKDPRFTNAIDQRTGYVTKHMLCAPIFDKRGDIVGVAQVINKRDGKPFTKSDELKFKRYLQFCGIGLRNAQSFEHCQLENRRNQVLLDLARMVFEEQSSIEEVVYRIMLHTQSLLDCERCQVLLIDNVADDTENLLRGLPDQLLNSTTKGHGPLNTQSSTNVDLASAPKLSAALDRSSSTRDWHPHCQTFELKENPPEKCQSAAEVISPLLVDDLEIQERELEEEVEEPQLSSKLFSLVFDLECDGDNNPVIYSREDKIQYHSDGVTHNGRRERDFPINIGITGYVAMTGETLNIEDAHSHERFDRSVDINSNFKHRSILCMPIRNGRRQIIGVSQLINKKNGRPFNKNDEDIFEAFSIFCGLGIHNTLMYERVLKIMAKQRVTFEVLSYHATAPLEEAKKLNQEQVPPSFALNLASLKFNDFSLDDQYMLKSCMRFFLDLDLMRRFQINQLVFCNWVLSVQKNYRKVTYHPIVGK